MNIDALSIRCYLLFLHLWLRISKQISCKSVSIFFLIFTAYFFNCFSYTMWLVYLIATHSIFIIKIDFYTISICSRLVFRLWCTLADIQLISFSSFEKYHNHHVILYAFIEFDALISFRNAISQIKQHFLSYATIITIYHLVWAIYDVNLVVFTFDWIFRLFILYLFLVCKLNWKVGHIDKIFWFMVSLSLRDQRMCSIRK